MRCPTLMRSCGLAVLLVTLGACQTALTVAHKSKSASAIDTASVQFDVEPLLSIDRQEEEGRSLGEQKRELRDKNWNYYYATYYNKFYNFYAANFYGYNFYNFYNYGAYNFYNFYTYGGYGWYNFYNWYAPYGYYDFYTYGYNWYDSFYTSGYDLYNAYAYDWYNWYGGGFYNYVYGYYYDWYDWYDSYYNYYSWYGGSNTNKFGRVQAYSYYYSQSETFSKGYSGYYYYYWYHYADSANHWEAKMKLGWTNWADVLEGASVLRATSFINTWKCHEENAMTNVLEMAHYRKDVCSNGDRRWIFSNDDDAQKIIVDLGQRRQISEIGVEFGDATARLPKGIVVSFLESADGKIDPHDFEEFGTLSSNVQQYVKALQPAPVTAQYIMWEFTQQNQGEGSAFMQLVAAGPAFDEHPSTGYIILAVVILLGIVVVFVLLYFLSKTTAVRRRFYRQTKKQIAKENAEFSSDSDSDSDSDCETDDFEFRKAEV